MSLRALSILPLVIALVGWSACVDPETVVDPPTAAVTALDEIPFDELVEDPPMLALARKLPSFGGYWYDDDGRIVIGLTTLDDRAVAESLVRDQLGDRQPPAGYAVVKVSHSFEDLARYRTHLRRQVFSIDDVVILGVKESLNYVHVGVTSLTAEAIVRNFARQIGIPDEVLVINLVEAPRPMSHTLQQSDSIIQGGWQIANEQNRGCTLGFAAVESDGTAVFVTNSHCTLRDHAYDGDDFFQPDTAGVLVGSEHLDPPVYSCGFTPSDCRASDAALISAAIDITLGTIARTTDREGSEGVAGDLTIDHTNPVITISGKASHVVENEQLDKVGRTTGWTYGAVEDTCIDTDGGSTWIVECSDRVDYHSDEGDSGAAVFSIEANGTATLRGINWGTVGWPYDDSYMSDIHQIQLDLGHLVVVDEHVNATISGPVSVPPSAACEWASNVSPGWPPYAYEWRRDAVVVSTDASYITNDTGTSDFQLTLKVTDGRNEYDFVVHDVTIDEGNPGFICD